MAKWVDNYEYNTNYKYYDSKALRLNILYISLFKALHMDGQNFLFPQNLLMIWCNNFPLDTTLRTIVNIRPVSGLHLKFLHLICYEHYGNENENDTNQVRDNIFQCDMTLNELNIFRSHKRIPNGHIGFCRIYQMYIIVQLLRW